MSTTPSHLCWKSARAAVGALGLWCAAGLSPAPASALVACGAKVAVDTTLTTADPVVLDATAQPGDAPCTGDGIVVTAPITLDCAGLTLKGSGKGTGIEVAGRVEGAVIQNCVVDGFGTGVALAGRGSHTLTKSLVVNSKTIGVRSTSDFNIINGVVARGNGTVGFQVKGDGSDVSLGNVAIQNGQAGFSLGGKESFYDSNLAVLNGDDGITGSVRGAFFSLNGAIANGGDGLTVKGGTPVLPNDYSVNRAVANQRSGIVVGGRNVNAEFDSGLNVGLANGGPIACQIAGQPCAP
jgi:hypothetical protein